MRIGVPKEIKTHEYRVGLTPESVCVLCRDGHDLLVESGAGEGIGATDADYRAAGAAIAANASDVFAAAELIVKVKEPQAPERALLRRGQTLFTYLHLAPDATQLRELLASGVTAIAYETVTAPGGGLPLLVPMSEVAGRMSIQVAAHFLERPSGGRGVLLPGASGVAPARVLVLGAGTVGAAAATLAARMGADVVVANRSQAALDRLVVQLATWPSLKWRTVLASAESIASELSQADAVIGAALVAGALAPRLVTRAMLASMRQGAVLVDVSIDQGGCFETSRPTTHADPVYMIEGILHYCVANMPGAVPRTSTYALNRATLPLVRRLAGEGVRSAMLADPHLRNGLNAHDGLVTCAEVATAAGVPWTEASRALAGSQGNS